MWSTNGLLQHTLDKLSVEELMVNTLIVEELTIGATPTRSIAANHEDDDG